MGTLEVAYVQLYDQNDAIEHRTDRFVSSESLVCLRRGQLFHVRVGFRGEYDPQTHRVILEFSTGSFPQFETCSSLRVRSSADEERVFPPPADDWGARRLHNSCEPDQDIVVEVVTPCWLPVGRWELRVHTNPHEVYDVDQSTYVSPGCLYFLFNPWNPEDDTYFPDAELLNEYVLSDVGKIVDGENSWKVWEFGQFDPCVLPAFEMALYEDDYLPHRKRGSAAEIVRTISRVGNANETGILFGKWDGGACKDGVSPFEWMGTKEILRQYLETKKPVKYGQCWVFAGVCATLCRALGIPARCVTNLESGHDTDMSLTIDILYDEQLNEIKGQSDSIWNFHVWTDCWMKRPDLSKDNTYDGWQAIDATPQEKSKDWYQCGPAPVKAVLLGHTHVSYDVPFVFSEVNGDRARWMRKRDGKLRLIDVSENIVGKLILTNQPLSDSTSGFQDITSEYKYQEGSKSERDVVDRATQNVRNISGEAKKRRIAIQQQRHTNDVAFEEKIPEGVTYGQNFEVIIEMQNNADEDRFILMEMTVESVDYKQKNPQRVRTSGTMEVRLYPGQRLTQLMPIHSQDYADVIQENHALRFSGKCLVQETGQPWLSERSWIDVYSPSLLIQCGELGAGVPAEVVVRFDSTVDFPLTNCRLTLLGSALGEPLVLYLPDVPPQEPFYACVEVCPVRSGDQKIIAKFTSSQLPKSESWIPVWVNPGGEEDQCSDEAPRLFARPPGFNIAETFSSLIDHGISFTDKFRTFSITTMKTT